MKTFRFAISSKFLKFSNKLQSKFASVKSLGYSDTNSDDQLQSIDLKNQVDTIANIDPSTDLQKYLDARNEIILSIQGWCDGILYKVYTRFQKKS